EEAVLAEEAACVVVTAAARLVVAAVVFAPAAIQPVSASMPAALAEPAARRARRAGCAFGRRFRATASVVLVFVSIGLPSRVRHGGLRLVLHHRGDSSDQPHGALGL